ncbi:hypothetical protein [Pontibacter akesuensis]|uniref:Lipoprotein n=1 Tax=Pontibacter akesuensis TaxID=388950 RepID=A0A1I7KST2_9BACT|nr:hypothetical protein [Pontibacter akesuensis]GHA80897.1 hypothetical protein GCM10007389_39240 [Pontibacter akesuensis]SFV00438.1 hypothetical protein SAMN04487941_4056 [Pontibacter akesuensis]
MNKLNLLLLWCLLLGAIVSCGDKDEDPEPIPTEATAALDYLPATKGSTWTYGGARPYSYTATGATKDFDGKTYKELQTTSGTEKTKSYLLKEKGVYTTIGFMPGSRNIKIAILKEETPVGKPWEQTYTFNAVETKMTFTIEEKDITKTVEGKTFKDVIHVKLVSTYSYLDMDFNNTHTSHYYFAKGVGLILSDLQEVGQIPLLTYDVK